MIDGISLFFTKRTLLVRLLSQVAVVETSYEELRWAFLQGLEVAMVDIAKFRRHSPYMAMGHKC